MHEYYVQIKGLMEVIYSTNAPTNDPTTDPTVDPTPPPTSCFNNIRGWSIDSIGSSSQFRFKNNCDERKQFLKIKMVSLIEYDSDNRETKNKINSFASSDWYWITNQDGQYDGYNAALNQYVSDINVRGTNVQFNLSTILFYQDADIGNETVEENTLKWTTDINNWPFLSDENKLELCLNVMTNGGNNKNNDDDNDNRTRFTFDDFEFRLIDFANCGDDQVDVDTDSIQKNGNHLDICFTFPACDDVIDHDPFVKYVGDVNPDEPTDKNSQIMQISLGVGIPLLMVGVIVAFGGYFYKKNKKLRNDVLLNNENDDGYDTMITDAST